LVSRIYHLDRAGVSHAGAVPTLPPKEQWLVYYYDGQYEY